MTETTSKAASVETLEALHRQLTECLIDALGQPEADAALTRAAVKFLRDNRITVHGTGVEAVKAALGRLRAHTLGSH